MCVGWNLSKLARILIWDCQNKLLDFGGIDLIFKVTTIIYNSAKKGLSVLYYLNQWQAFDQTDIDTALKNLNE